jgi:hypothetical protein
MFLRELIKEDVKPNAYEKLKAEFPNLNTILRYVPGVGQAMAVADAASAIDMYQKTMADIEAKYPNIINTLKPDPHLNNISASPDDIASFEKDMTPVEDYDPNDPPPGPETQPTMPAGTVRVDVSDVYDWYKLGKNISNLKGAKASDFGKGPPSTIMSFGSEEEEHKYINDLKKLGLSTTDIDPLDPNQPKNMPRQKTDPTYNVGENFADGKHPEDKGDSKRHGVPTKASVSTLRKVAKQGGRKGQLAHWMANMKAGKKKSLNEAVIHPSTMDALEDFLPFVMKLLKLDKLPRISVHKTIETGDQPSFGGYNPEDGTIQLALKDRHPADVLRTLAHELVHFKQDQQGELDEQSGATGSNEENEANTKAGIIMRHFNKRFPQYLE